MIWVNGFLGVGAGLLLWFSWVSIGDQYDTILESELGEFSAESGLKKLDSLKLDR